MPILDPADSGVLVTEGGFCTTLDMGICFAAGTPVLMADGTTKPIETLQPGDQVLAAPEHDAEAEPAAKTVERVFHNPPSELVILTIGETQLRCTPPHRFYIKDKDWTAAEDLQAGDQLWTSDGRWVTLDGKAEQHEPEPVFNLQVADHHTYFVGDPQAGHAILVHNECTGLLGDLSGLSTYVGIFGTHQDAGNIQTDSGNLLFAQVLSNTSLLGQVDSLPTSPLSSLAQYTLPTWSEQLSQSLPQLAFSQSNGAGAHVQLDAAGNLASITDALGNRASYTHDALGNTTSLTLPTGHTTHFAYDADSRLTEVTDPVGNKTVYTFNDEGQLASETIVVDGETLTRSHEYDEDGNEVREIDRNGRVTVFAYDAAGRLVQETWYNDEADADADQNRQNTITWTYDAEGNLTSVVDNSSTYTYTHDEAGRVVTQTVSIVDGPVTVLTVDYGDRDDDQPVSVSATVDGTPDFLTTYRFCPKPRFFACCSWSYSASYSLFLWRIDRGGAELSLGCVWLAS